MILVIDNYDSFTWNLVDILRRGQRPVTVLRNDEVTVADALAMQPAGVLISPGPGRPKDSGVSWELVEACIPDIPVLGICLGHQLLGEMFGARLIHAPAPVHGKTSSIEHDKTGIFRGLPSPMQVMRYHSLSLATKDFPRDLEITATTQAGEVMGIRHNFLNFTGVQFHPESILTKHGNQIVRNWMRIVDVNAAEHENNFKVIR